LPIIYTTATDYNADYEADYETDIEIDYFLHSFSKIFRFRNIDLLLQCTVCTLHTRVLLPVLAMILMAGGWLHND